MRVAYWRDGDCQQRAAASASKAARLSQDKITEIRALIVESRASIALQDFSRGEMLLTQAELALKTQNAPTLQAEVSLAYSSMSFTLGKFEVSKTYAEQGLQNFPDNLDEGLRARLLRNLARAQSKLR
ncbi:hypothetical protein HC761_01380 [bacterium]|nr:hypothetical protein [bacterium]